MMNWLYKLVPSWLRKFILGLWGSFTDTRGSGLSARKLTACALIYMAFRAQDRKLTEENLVTIVLIDLGFAALLLGIITVQQLIELKNGNTAKPVQPADASTEETK